MYAHDIRCPTNVTRPRYVGICERTGFKFYYDDLTFQYDWRGNSLVNLNILVGQPFIDKPQEQLRPVITGPDSLPPFPRPSPPSYETQAAGGVPGPLTAITPVSRLFILGDSELGGGDVLGNGVLGGG